MAADAAGHRFDRAAADYDAVRPGYPPELVAWLCERAGVGPADPALDLGAGTGLFAGRLAELGLELTAAEPNERMREVLARRVPGAKLLAERAERLSLGDDSVALATAAQAFHWFEQPAALLEIRRVLRPGGCLAVIWITGGEHPVSERIETLSWGLLAEQGGAVGPMPGEPLGWDACFEPLERREFPFSWTVPAGRLSSYVGSFSVVANLPSEERRALLAEVGAWPEGEQDLELAYRAEVNLARVR